VVWAGVGEGMRWGEDDVWCGPGWVKACREAMVMCGVGRGGLIDEW